MQETLRALLIQDMARALLLAAAAAVIVLLSGRAWIELLKRWNIR